MYPLNYLPTEYSLVPNLGVLRRLLLERTPVDNHTKVCRGIEQLPYYLRGACEAWLRLEQLRIAAREWFVLNSRIGARWFITGDCADGMAYAADAYLANLHRSVEGLLDFMNRCPEHVGLSTSIHQTADKLAKGAYPKLDKKLKDLTLAYWNEMGQRVKGYRDQGSHFGISPSSCLMFYQNPTGNVGLQLLLPDRHEAKSASDMTYNPGISAIAFLCESLASTLVFVNKSVERMIDLESTGTSDPRGAALMMVNKRGGGVIDPKEDNPMGGEMVPFYNSLQSMVNNWVAEAVPIRAKVEDYDETKHGPDSTDTIEDSGT
jgi:hypothetical protein